MKKHTYEFTGKLRQGGLLTSRIEAINLNNAVLKIGYLYPGIHRLVNISQITFL